MSDDSSDKPSVLADIISWGPLWANFLTVSAYVGSILFAYIVSYILPKNLSDFNSTIILYVASSAALVSFVWLFLKLKAISWRSFMGKFSAGQLTYIPIFYGLYFVLTYTVQTALNHIPGYQPDQSQSFGLDGAHGSSLIGVMLVLVILPPIAEELLFRGILYRGLSKKWGRVAAALVTSAIFGLIHGQWNVAADTFVLSLVLITALEKTKSLYVPMGIHILKNLVAYLLVFVLIK